MKIELRQSYPPKGDLSNFEAYMFITTNKFISQHDELPQTEIMVMNCDRAEGYNLQYIRQRKDALHNFNVYLTRNIGHYPKAGELSFFILYIDTDSKYEDNDADQLNVYHTVRKMAADYCKDQKVVMALVPHFHQVGHLPHIHFLYYCNQNKNSEFQKYIKQRL